jgi:hypothetical protein
MSQFKKSLDSEILKEKFSTLLKNLDRTNTSKMIIERCYGELCSLELAEGKVNPNDVMDELKGIGVEQNKARHLITASTLNEKKSSTADQFLLQRVAILENACKQLGAYSWMKPIGTFINETQEFLKRNELAIIIERVIFDLEVSRDSGYYKKAIDKLVEASNSENPVFTILETMETEKWIPLVKRIYEYCDKIKGSINGHNPNFKVSKIYSPVEFIEESGNYVFFSNGKVLETNGETIVESEKEISESFKSLVSITETSRFDKGVIRMYPNPSSIVDVDFNGESAKIVINNKIVESSNVESFMLASGFLKYTEKDKVAKIMHAISEGNNIKELDFGYRVTSSVFEGVSVNVFTLNENIYIQKINRGMKENSLVLAESAEHAVSIVKDFMNYDISNSLTHLLETEKAEQLVKEKELQRVNSRIKFLMESLENLDRAAKINGVETSTQVVKAKELLESQITIHKAELDKINSKVEEASTEEPKKEEPKTEDPINEDHCTPGKEYTIKGEAGWVYQGETDGVHIFNNDKGGFDPKTYDDKAWIEAHKTGEIVECM